MGEIVCLEEYKRKKDEEEAKKISDDIEALREELNDIYKFLKDPDAHLFFERGYEDIIPLIVKLDESFDSYYQYPEEDDTEEG